MLPKEAALQMQFTAETFPVKRGPQVLPYHTLGLFKWQKLGIPYPLPDAVPPTAQQVKRAEELLEVSRYPG